MRSQIFQHRLAEGQDFNFYARPVDAARTILVAANVTNYDRRIFDLSTIPTQATGSITFTTNASAGDLLTVNDGSSQSIFEFVASAGTGASTSDVEVVVGATRADTVTALLAALQARGDSTTDLMDIDAVIDPSNADKINLTHRRFGQVGNQDLDQSAGSTGRYTIAGMSGALDDSVPLHEVIGGASADVLQAVKSTGSEWVKDRIGYTFSDTVKASDYSPKGGRRYAVEWDLLVTGGGKVRIRAEVEHVSRLSS